MTDEITMTDGTPEIVLSDETVEQIGEAVNEVTTTDVVTQVSNTGDALATAFGDDSAGGGSDGDTGGTSDGDTGGASKSDDSGGDDDGDDSDDGNEGTNTLNQPAKERGDKTNLICS